MKFLNFMWPIKIHKMKYCYQIVFWNSVLACKLLQWFDDQFALYTKALSINMSGDTHLENLENLTAYSPTLAKISSWQIPKQSVLRNYFASARNFNGFLR